jgi:transcriptional regulator with XRE-family HTH domain
MSHFPTTEQSERLVNYLRTHRKKTGLSQRDLGRILGYGDEGPVSRHEQFHALPPLLIALGYEIVFQVPIAEIFAGLRDAVEQNIEKRLSELEQELQQSSGRGRRAAGTARTLEWLYLRRDAALK